MKLNVLLTCLLVNQQLVEGFAIANPSKTFSLAKETLEASTFSKSLSSANSAVSSYVPLEKRYRKVIVPTTSSSSEDAEPESWIRTIYSSVVEIVHPTVIGGVTFSDKPFTSDGPEPWVSLNKNGEPKTIKPQIKNGITKNGKPEYGTFFQTSTVVVHLNKNLKAHNLDEDETFTEIKWIPEDDTYVNLNPVIRCTPDRYFKKGLAKDVSSEPFCSPQENSNILLDKTYFVTWYTRFFEDAEKVRLHLAYIKEDQHDKGMRKRDETEKDSIVLESLDKRDNTASGTNIAFFSSDWFLNRDGIYPLQVKEEWLKGKYFKPFKAVFISVQPDNIADEDFDMLEYGIPVMIGKGSKVFKKSREQLAIEDQGGVGENESKYIILMTMPTMVIVACCLMYFLTQLCNKDRDVGSVRREYFAKRFHKVIGKPKKLFSKTKSGKGYKKLPEYNADIELDKRD